MNEKELNRHLPRYLSVADRLIPFGIRSPTLLSVMEWFQIPFEKWEMRSVILIRGILLRMLTVCLIFLV